ncbi:MAG TPA: UGSC family (seleno)protein, partial [Candidatus Aquilonibacter sp.]|nr:UGSC family (seleno)protein [Candidatus Aquilonibacter sp.]
PATVGHCITLEKMGIPTAPMVTIAFKDLALSNAAQRGMPHERICFTPHPVWGKTDAEMYAYLEGNDPVSGKPLMKEVIGALTDPLTDEEKKTGTVPPSVGPPTFIDTSDNLQQYYMDNGMTDFMQIVLPTQGRVDAMLKGTSHSPDEIIGKMSPARGSYPDWTFNVRQVAINAVMAGCKPEYLPIVLALAASSLTALSSSTNSFSVAAVINGPIRDKLNMNYGIGAMGPFSQPNATIGRAWTMLSKNLSNSGTPGETYFGTYGNSTNFGNLIIPENEKDSPWAPLHVQKGYKPEESVASVFLGFSISQGQGGAGLGVKPVPQYQQALAYNFTPFGPLFGALGVLDPLVAKGLAELGFDTKEKLADWLQKNSTISAKDARSTLFGARWVPDPKTPDDALIPRYARADSYNFVVVGGQTNPYHMVANMSYRSSVSIDKWT